MIKGCVQSSGFQPPHAGHHFARVIDDEMAAIGRIHGPLGPVGEVDVAKDFHGSQPVHQTEATPAKVENFKSPLRLSGRVCSWRRPHEIQPPRDPVALPRPCRAVLCYSTGGG